MSPSLGRLPSQRRLYAGQPLEGTPGLTHDRPPKEKRRRWGKGEKEEEGSASDTYHHWGRIV